MTAASLGDGAKPSIIFLIFTGVGPLIGFVALLIASGIWQAFTETAPRRAGITLSGIAGAIRAVLLFYPLALLFGGIQAAFVGLTAALTFRAFGKVRFKVVMLASLATWIGFVAIVTLASLQARDAVKTPGWIWGWAIPHLAAGAGGWLLVSRFRASANPS